MKRVAVLAIVLMGWAGTTLFAQDPFHLTNLNGFGGFGFNRTAIESAGPVRTSYLDLLGELGLSAEGSFYDPRLAGYSLSTSWDDNNTSLNQGSSHVNGLNYNGNISFLPERSCPFSFYFSQNHTNTVSSLIPAYRLLYSIRGIRGDIKGLRLAKISYNFGTSSSENDYTNGPLFKTRQRFADLAATRKLAGWDLRISDDYYRTEGNYAVLSSGYNRLDFTANHNYGDKFLISLGASDSTFSVKSPGQPTSSDSSVLSTYGNATVRHTERLTSTYHFAFSRSAENTLAFLGQATGIPVPANAASLNPSTVSAGTDLIYRVTDRLTVNGGLSYMHSGIVAGAANPSTTQVYATTGVLSPNVGYGYFRKIWKLNFTNEGALNWQRYTLVNQTSQSGLGYDFDNQVQGGNVRKLRFTLSQRLDKRTNPFFFTITQSSDMRAALGLESEYFRFVDLRGLADVGTTTLDLFGSHLNVDTSQYMASATFPKRKLSISASRSVSNSLEQFFGPDSILFQPGGSTGAAPIPMDLLSPSVVSNAIAQRVMLTWRPRPNLEIQSSYNNNHLLFALRNPFENVYNEFDTIVSYKFGRFTIYAGYGRARIETLPSYNMTNRIFFRVRFPFHILG